MTVMIEKYEECPKCDADGEAWLYDGQICKRCGYNGNRVFSDKIDQRSKEARRAALEEAAKVADKIAEDHEQRAKKYRLAGLPEFWQQAENLRAVAVCVAVEIRALMEES